MPVFLCKGTSNSSLLFLSLSLPSSALPPHLPIASCCDMAEANNSGPIQGIYLEHLEDLVSQGIDFELSLRNIDPKGSIWLPREFFDELRF